MKIEIPYIQGKASGLGGPPMKIQIEYLVIIALVALFVGWILMNHNKLSAGENFIAASDADIGQESTYS